MKGGLELFRTYCTIDNVLVVLHVVSGGREDRFIEHKTRDAGLMLKEDVVLIVPFEMPVVPSLYGGMCMHECVCGKAPPPSKRIGTPPLYSVHVSRVSDDAVAHSLTHHHLPSLLPAHDSDSEPCLTFLFSSDPQCSILPL